MSPTLASILDYICSFWWFEPLFSLSIGPTLAPLAIPKLNTQINKKKFDRNWIRLSNPQPSFMNLVCALFVVGGGWLTANSYNWTAAKLKLHFIVAYRMTNVSFWQLGLCQPTNNWYQNFCMCPKFSWCNSVEGRVADIITNQGSWFESYLEYIFSNTIDVVIEVGLRLRLATFLFILMKVFAIFL